MNLFLLILTLLFGFSTPFPDKAEKIVSLAPNLTEIVYALGIGDRLIGVTDFCDYPEAAIAIDKVGGYIDPNLERITAMQPDLVLALPEHQTTIQRLKVLGLNVATVKNWSIADIHSSIETTGKLTGREQAASNLLNRLEQRQKQLLRKRETPVKCLLVLGHEVSGGGIKELFIVGRNGFLNELIELAGGENVFRQKNPHFPKISREGLIQLDPDVIIELVPYPDPDGKDSERRKSAWGTVEHLRAVEAGEVHVIRGAYLLRAGPRYLDALDALVKVLDDL